MSEYAENAINQLDGQHDKVFKLVLDNRVIKELIIFLNTDDQLGEDGTDSLGASLGVYSFATEVISGGKKKQGDPINLNDTEAFWNSWKVMVQSGNIIIDADPFKEDTNLFDEFGIDVLGLTDENLQILINESLEKYIRWYEDNILPR